MQYFLAEIKINPRITNSTFRISEIYFSMLKRQGQIQTSSFTRMLRHKRCEAGTERTLTLSHIHAKRKGPFISLINKTSQIFVIHYCYNTQKHPLLRYNLITTIQFKDTKPSNSVFFPVQINKKKTKNLIFFIILAYLRAYFFQALYDKV